MESSRRFRLAIIMRIHICSIYHLHYIFIIHIHRLRSPLQKIHRRCQSWMHRSVSRIPIIEIEFNSSSSDCRILGVISQVRIRIVVETLSRAHNLKNALVRCPMTQSNMSYVRQIYRCRRRYRPFLTIRRRSVAEEITNFVALG